MAKIKHLFLMIQRYLYYGPATHINGRSGKPVLKDKKVENRIITMLRVMPIEIFIFLYT